MSLLDVLKPQKPPKPSDPYVVHTLDGKILRDREIKRKQQAAAQNLKQYLRRIGKL